MIRVCRSCGLDFEVPLANPKQPTCSRRCARAGNINPRYNGGLTFSKLHQRWMIHCRDGSKMYYYRGVMAAKIGRLLEPHEIVHHRNGDSTDDRVENLQIVTRSEHIAMHRAEINAGRAA